MRRIFELPDGQVIGARPLTLSSENARIHLPGRSA
jgi:hypothetical protein